MTAPSYQRALQLVKERRVADRRSEHANDRFGRGKKAPSPNKQSSIAVTFNAKLPGMTLVPGPVP